MLLCFLWRVIFCVLTGCYVWLFFFFLFCFVQDRFAIRLPPATQSTALNCTTPPQDKADPNVQLEPSIARAVLGGLGWVLGRVEEALAFRPSPLPYISNTKKRPQTDPNRTKKRNKTPPLNRETLDLDGAKRQLQNGSPKRQGKASPSCLKTWLIAPIRGEQGNTQQSITVALLAMACTEGAQWQI